MALISALIDFWKVWIIALAISGLIVWLVKRSKTSALIGFLISAVAIAFFVSCEVGIQNGQHQVWEEGTGFWKCNGEVGNPFQGDCKEQLRERSAELTRCSEIYFSNDDAEAVQCFGRYISKAETGKVRGGTKGEGNYWRGYTYIRMREHQLARTDFFKVLDHGRYKALAYQALGDLSLSEGDSDNARKYYRLSLEETDLGAINPELPSIYIGFAKSYLKEQDVEMAVQHMKRALLVASHYHPDREVSEFYVPAEDSVSSRDKIGLRLPLDNYRLRDALEWMINSLDGIDEPSAVYAATIFKLVSGIERCSLAECYKDLLIDHLESPVVTENRILAPIVEQCKEHLIERQEWETYLSGSCEGITDGTQNTHHTTGSTFVSQLNELELYLNYRAYSDPSSSVETQLNAHQRWVSSDENLSPFGLPHLQLLRGKFHMLRNDRVQAIDEFTKGIEMLETEEPVLADRSRLPAFFSIDFGDAAINKAIYRIGEVKENVDRPDRAKIELQKDLYRGRAEAFESIGQMEKAQPDRAKLANLPGQVSGLGVHYDYEKIAEVLNHIPPFVFDE